MKPLWNSVVFRAFRLLCFLVLVGLWAFNYIVKIAPYLSDALDIDQHKIERFALLLLPLYAAVWLLTKIAPHVTQEGSMRRRERITFWCLVLWLFVLYFPAIETLFATSVPLAWQHAVMGHFIGLTGLKVPVKWWPYLLNTVSIVLVCLPVGVMAYAFTLVLFRRYLPFVPKFD